MIGNIDAPSQHACEDRVPNEDIEYDEVMEQLSPPPDDGGGEITLPHTATDTHTGTNSNTFRAPVLKKANKSKSNTLAQFLALEAKKVAHLEQMKKACTSSNETQDDDYHFLMSLLPHFRAIPSQRKLTVRTRIQEVLLEEEKGQLQYLRYSPSLSTSTQSSQHQQPSNNLRAYLSSWQGEGDYERNIHYSKLF